MFTWPGAWTAVVAAIAARRESCLVAAAMALFAASTASATDFFWTGFAGAAFTDPHNWTPYLPLFSTEGPGGPGDTVNFDRGVQPSDRYDVMGVAGENDRLLVHNDWLTLYVANGPNDVDYALLNPSLETPSFVVGNAAGDVADLVLSGLGDAHIVSDASSIGLGSGSLGALTVERLSWKTDVLNVGRSGEGTLAIKSGGYVDSPVATIASDPGSHGTASVSGVGASWDAVALVVGLNGDGRLTIEARGQVATGLLADLVSGSVGYWDGSTGAVTVTGAGAAWNNSGRLIVGLAGDGEMAIESGGAVTSNGMGTIAGADQSSGRVTVSGFQSSWSNAGLLVVGSSGDADLTINSGGTVISAGAVIADNVESSSTATITGAGSTWTIAEEAGLYVGGSSLFPGGDATLAIDDQGVVEVDGQITIWPTGAVHINGGTLRAHGDLNLSGGVLRLNSFDEIDGPGGAFHWTSGTVHVTGPAGVTLGSSTGFSPAMSLDAGKALTVDHQIEAPAGMALTLNGGVLRTKDLIVEGEFAFQSGVLELAGGSISGSAALSIPANGTLRGSGAADVPVAGAVGSEIIASGDLELGEAADVNGFRTAGALAIGAHSVTLNDANLGVLESGALVTLGESGVAGTLAAPNGLTLQAGAKITGFGVVDTPDDPARPMVINGLLNEGQVIGNSPADPITLSGFVTGPAKLDNVVITGTISPGLDGPRTVFHGNVNYAGRIEIEIGGTHQELFDILVHNRPVTLGGMLEVALIDDFNPAAGNKFEVLFLGAGYSGAFSEVVLPTLADGLGWDLVYEPNGVSLRVVPVFAADFDGDVDVDGDDLVQWQGDFGENAMSDADNDGDSDGADFLTWQREVGSPAATPVVEAPEPAGASLGVIALVLLRAAGARAIRYAGRTAVPLAGQPG